MFVYVHKYLLIKFGNKLFATYYLNGKASLWWNIQLVNCLKEYCPSNN